MEVVPEQKAIPDATLTAVAAAVAVAGTKADAVAEVAVGSGSELESEAPGITRVASAMVLEATVGGQPRTVSEQGPAVEVPGSGLAQEQVRAQMKQRE